MNLSKGQIKITKISTINGAIKWEKVNKVINKSDLEKYRNELKQERKVKDVHFQYEEK